MVQLTVLSQLQYCVVVDPLDSDGRPQLGCRQLRKGPATFFLHPGMAFVVHFPNLPHYVVFAGLGM